MRGKRDDRDRTKTRERRKLGNGNWATTEKDELMDSRKLRGYALIAIIVAALGGLIWYIASGDSGEARPFDNRAPNMVYMAVLLVVLLGSLIASRPRFGEVGKAIVVWGGLGLVLVAGYAFKDDFAAIGARTMAALVPGMAMSTGDADGSVMVVRGSDRHFHIDGDIGGTSIAFMVDTGATSTTLTAEDARRIGIDTSALTYGIPIMTANGRASVGQTRVGPVQVGPVRIPEMSVLVARPGMLGTSLLGMDFLSRLSSWTVRGDRLVLTP